MKKIQQNSTKTTKKFVPSISMNKWLASAEKLGVNAGPTEISKDSGVDRTNWYKWQDIPEFVEWWDASWKKYIKLHRHKLDLIGLKQAEKNHDWWRDMKKVVGEPVPEDIVQPVNPTMQNNIILSPEQIKRIIED